MPCAACHALRAMRCVSRVEFLGQFWPTFRILPRPRNNTTQHHTTTMFSRVLKEHQAKQSVIKDENGMMTAHATPSHTSTQSAEHHAAPRSTTQHHAAPRRAHTCNTRNITLISHYHIYYNKILIYITCRQNEESCSSISHQCDE